MSTIEVSPLAAKLRGLREYLGMGRTAFAELLGIPPTTLKNYENGYREAIPASVIVVLANTPATADFVPALLAHSSPVDDLSADDEVAS